MAVHTVLTSHDLVWCILTKLPPQNICQLSAVNRVWYQAACKIDSRRNFLLKNMYKFIANRKEQNPNERSLTFLTEDMFELMERWMKLEDTEEEIWMNLLQILGEIVFTADHDSREELARRGRCKLFQKDRTCWTCCHFG